MRCLYKRQPGGGWRCSVCGRSYLGSTIDPPKRMCWTYRTGNILHDLLRKRLGVGFDASCACREWTSRMNAWGPEGCWVHLPEIVGHLLAEAKRREWKLNGRPVLSGAANLGTRLPGGMAFARAWARRLVLRAIRECREVE